MREVQQDPAAGAGAPVPASNPPDDAGARHLAVPPSDGEQLRDIWSVTDAALSALDPQAVLEVLVARVRDALRADTAAILLLDPPSDQLVARRPAGSKKRSSRVCGSRWGEGLRASRGAAPPGGAGQG